MAKAGPPSEERKARTRGNRGRGSTPSARKPLVSDKPKFDMEPNVDAIEGNSPINRTETEHTNNQGTDVDMQEVVVGCGDISGVSEDHENDEDSNSTVSTTSDSSSSEDDSGDDEEIELENENGMCHYELMRQRRIARNEERLAGLGLSQIQKSTVMVVKKPTRSSKPLPQGPRRTLPGRKGRAQFFENMKAVTKVKEKVVEEEKNPEACDVCQSEEGGAYVSVADLLIIAKNLRFDMIFLHIFIRTSVLRVLHEAVPPGLPQATDNKHKQQQ